MLHFHWISAKILEWLESHTIARVFSSTSSPGGGLDFVCENVSWSLNKSCFFFLFCFFVQCHYGHYAHGIRGRNYGKNLVISTFTWSGGLIFCVDSIDQLKIITPPPQVCTGATKCDGCITSSATLLTLMHPSLWNRLVTFFPNAPESNLYSPEQTEAFFFSFFLIHLTHKYLSHIYTAI